MPLSGPLLGLSGETRHRCPEHPTEERGLDTRAPHPIQPLLVTCIRFSPHKAWVFETGASAYILGPQG